MGFTVENDLNTERSRRLFHLERQRADSLLPVGIR